MLQQYIGNYIQLILVDRFICISSPEIISRLDVCNGCDFEVEEIEEISVKGLGLSDCTDEDLFMEVACEGNLTGFTTIFLKENHKQEILYGIEMSFEDREEFCFFTAAGDFEVRSGEMLWRFLRHNSSGFPNVVVSRYGAHVSMRLKNEEV